MATTAAPVQIPKTRHEIGSRVATLATVREVTRQLAKGRRAEAHALPLFGPGEALKPQEQPETAPGLGMLMLLRKIAHRGRAAWALYSPEPG